MRKVKVEKAVEVSKQQQQQETTIKLEEDEEETFVKEEFIELLKNRLVNETVLSRQDIEGEWNLFPICNGCMQWFGSGLNQGSGFGSVFGILIRIQEGKNYPQS